MAILAKRPSDVRFYETDLSAFIINNSSAAVGQVVVSAQGPTVPTHYSNFDDYMFDFGRPKAQVSFDHYMAKDYFKEGNNLIACRAVGTGAVISAILMKINSSGDTVLQPITAGLSQTSLIDWNTYVAVGETPVVMFYAKKGPGSYGNNYAIEILSDNVPAPTSLNGTTAGTGGFLPDGSYDYVVSAISANGESLASVPNTFVLASSTSTNKITLTWSSVVGAIGYRIYRKLTASSTYSLLDIVGANTATLVDDGNSIPDATKTPILSPAGLPPPSPKFTVKVFDYTQALTVPVEVFECSLTDLLDETGSQMSVQDRLNPFSRYISASNNTSALVSIPSLKPAQATALAGGASGSAPTSSQIVQTWQKFLNKEAYVVDILMEPRSSVIVQNAVITLAETRGDAVAFIAVPPASQGAYDAADFRNVTLNRSSSYAALFTSDTLDNDDINGKQLYLPGVGKAAALYARTSRIGQPWYSIAGPNRGQVECLSLRHKYDEGESQALVDAKVNYFKTLRGRGTFLLEQFTLSAANSAFQFLQVRFLLNVMKRSMYDFLFYGLQEQNDEILHRKLKFGLEDYLTTVQAQQGIKSFRVVINAGNNPASYVNSGILGITVFFIPILAAREIRLTLGVGKEGLTLSEAEIAAIGV